MTDKHSPTPTPWFVDIGPKDEQPAAGLVAKHPTKPNMKMSIGILFEGYHAGEAQANAVFIVKSCNAYAPMVDALKEIARETTENLGNPTHAATIAKQALSILESEAR